jgi:hypothetical protein
MRQFDLNMERVLENWTTPHAVRELIANALDEQALTGTAEPEIVKDDHGRWHVRDYGRGLKYQHLTQNENKEKLRNPRQVVGKFGVGLKDALATFDRRDVDVLVESRHGRITTAKASKHGFEDIKTLHALVDEPSDGSMIGTDVVLDGVSDDEIAEAKSLFLRYSGDRCIESTGPGEILERSKGGGRIYVNGLRVAVEENFLFSYNITSPTKRLRAALNRERSHVGRTAYADRVKAILLVCGSEEATEALAHDLEGYQSGKWREETRWVDVAVHACGVLNARSDVIFLTAEEQWDAGAVVSRAKADGYQVILVPETVRRKLKNAVDIEGDPIRDLDQYQLEWNASFQFSFVEPDKLTGKERAVFEKTAAILALRGGKPRQVRTIAISETMRFSTGGRFEALGVWEPTEARVVIKRSQLKSLEVYAGTLLHEIAHAVSGAGDRSEEFEEALTKELGVVAATQSSHDGSR